MALLERFQNPVTGDTVRLRLLTYDSNALFNVSSVDSVEIYFYDPATKSDTNPQGLTLIDTIPGAAVQHLDTGQYAVEIYLETDKYVIGRYVDKWKIHPVAELPQVTAESQFFDVYPHLFYTSPSPVVNDFTFHFQPNRMRKGSKQYLTVEVVPNVPNASDMQRYYEMIIAVAQLYISIAKSGGCGSCDTDSDEDMLVENEHIAFREKRFGYYQLDTEDMDCGLYDVSFRLELGDNIYISDKMQLQVF